MTNHEMELHYTENKCIYMEGRESCRIPIPVDRCPLNKLSSVKKIFVVIKLKPLKSVIRVKFLFQINTAGSTSSNSSDLQKICVDHIASLADLKWHLLGTESKGRATLSGLTLTQDMLDLVRMSPLQWGKFPKEVFSRYLQLLQKIS